MPVGPRPSPPSDHARVAISGTILGHPWVNTFYLHCAKTGAVTVNDLEDVADFISSEWNTTIAPNVASSVVMTQVAITYYTGPGTDLVFVKAYSHAGGGGAAVQDAGASWVVDFVISSSYRGGHPRWYVPGVDASIITNGSVIDTTRFNNLITQVNVFRNALNAHTTTNLTAITMGVVRFAALKAWLTPPVFWPYTSVKVGKHYKLGSQRRRILA